MTQRLADAFNVLGKLDRAGLLLRDGVVLRAIQMHPGSHGTEICEIIGIANRSALQFCFPRLIRHGLVEDRRQREARACPSCFHLTEQGEAFMKTLLGPMENET